MLHAGVSFGSSSYVMANAGVTFRLGKKSAKEALPERFRNGTISSVYILAQENVELREKVDALSQENREIKEKLDEVLKLIENK